MSKEKKPQAEADDITPVPSATKQVPDAVMYVGPDIKWPFPVSKGTVFHSGLPAILKSTASKDPDLAALFVQMKDAGKALRELKDKAGALVKHAKAIARQNVERRK
ncbi:hypothetical protein LJC71_04955 [Desulfosarcina sp. OttesenSCG-928-A07]|nr:hypothetical protein [Desulfosarcina sp. OttesenSCG-928-G17]MDL2329087.1 hypothetical protein [Desulfosarcina sp. OttesenSCG-928-A07]